MKRMIRMALGAGAALLAVGCTQESVVDKAAVQKPAELPMQFMIKQSNMTRATTYTDLLDESINRDNFGVWAYKTNGVTGDVMNNYKVQYTTIDGSTAWFYNGIEGVPEQTQTTKYWDNTSDKYEFYAYSPFSTTATMNASTRVMSLGTFTMVSKVDADPTKALDISTAIMAKKVDVAYANYGKPVAIQFSRFNCKVQVLLLSSLNSHYTVTIGTSETDTDGETLLHPGVKATGTMIKSANVSFNGSNWIWNHDGITRGDDTNVEGLGEYTLDFNNNGTTVANKSVGTLLTTKYFCIPSHTDTGKANGDLTFEVPFTATDGTDTHEKVASITIPAKYNNWAPNKVYTYKFNIGGMKPITFAGITVEDYTDVTISESPLQDIDLE